VSFANANTVFEAGTSEDVDRNYNHIRMEATDGSDRPSFIVGEDEQSEANEANDEFPQNLQNGLKPKYEETNVNEKRRRLR
jgi:hypothetical protein